MKVTELSKKGLKTNLAVFIAKKIVEEKKIFYVSNKCIKQEYQKLFLKISPVFPALKTN